MHEPDVTMMLWAWGEGKADAGDQLFSLVYDELRAIASAHHRTQTTIGPTALVHEAFLQLARGKKLDWRDRTQFYAFTSLVMRRFMANYWRGKRAGKRGGGVETVVFDDAIAPMFEAGIDGESLDQALTRLDSLDPRLSRIVELRFFGGLSMEETAEHLGLSRRTVTRDWGMAKSFLAAQLSR
jgi:RNA polymerase sigma factor (TIGR02999 family)